MDYIYNYDDSGLKIVVLLDKQFKTTNGVNFIENVRTDLLSKFTIEELSKKNPNQLKDSYKKTLAQIMTNFNSNFVDSLAVAKAKVVNLENMVVENYNATLKRNTEISNIKDQVDLLEQNSTKIKLNAVKLRKSTERQYYFFYAVGGGIILVS